MFQNKFILLFPLSPPFPFHICSLLHLEAFALFCTISEAVPGAFYAMHFVKANLRLSNTLSPSPNSWNPSPSLLLLILGIQKG